MLLTLWAFCALGQMIIIKLDVTFDQPVAGFSLFMLLMMILLCLIPFHCFYRTARLEIIKVLFQVMISPFSVVRFKQFIIADIITSFVNPLKDLGYVACFYIHGLWLDSTEPNIEKCYLLKEYTYIVMFIPFWFRFAQSLWRYRDNKLKRNLVNAAKYISIMVMAGLYVTYMETKKSYVLVIYVFYGFLNTIYCLSWDFYMDWGLFRS